MLKPLTDDDPRAIGPYRIANRIGAGGMGTVYLGFGPDGRSAAVKVPTVGLAHDVEFRTRFRQEVAAARRVHGSRVAAVLDADVDADRPWMATEYVEGSDLSDAVHTRGRFEGTMLTGLATGLAEALAAIHSAGVIHRDLKPANILLSWEGPKVIDFGIARAMDATRHTRTGMIVGTMVWMAPEQLRGERAGTPADIFAWGSCIAFAGTGHPPFRGERPEAVALKIIDGEPDLGGLPAEIVPLVRETLAKDPATRPTAAELVNRLAAAASGTAVTARFAGELPTGTTAPAPVPPMPPAPPERVGAGAAGTYGAYDSGGSGRRPYPPTGTPPPEWRDQPATGRSRMPVVLAAVVFLLLVAAALTAALVASNSGSPGTDTGTVPSASATTGQSGRHAPAPQSPPPNTGNEPEPSGTTSPDTGQSPTGTASPTASPTSSPTTSPSPSPSESPTRSPSPTTSPPAPNPTTPRPAPTSAPLQGGNAPGPGPR